jgi:hypothetical protein
MEGVWAEREGVQALPCLEGGSAGSEGGLGAHRERVQALPCLEGGGAGSEGGGAGSPSFATVVFKTLGTYQKWLIYFCCALIHKVLVY